MDKTVVVEVEDRVQHPLYGKTIRRTSKLKAHDEGDAGVGDRVLLMETRPLSATVALARRGGPGAVPQMIQQESRLRSPTTPAPRSCSASGCSAARAGATPASATSSSAP